MDCGPVQQIRRNLKILVVIDVVIKLCCKWLWDCAQNIIFRQIALLTHKTAAMHGQISLKNSEWC